MSYQGRTMVPIYLLQQAGVSYTWDQENQTVNVSIQSKIEPEPPFDAAKTAIDIIEQGGGGVTIVKENGATTALVFMEKIKGFEQDWDRMANIFTLLLEYKTSILKINYGDGDNQIGTISIDSYTFSGFLKGTVTADQLGNKWAITGKIGQIPQTAKEIARLMDRNYIIRHSRV